MSEFGVRIGLIQAGSLYEVNHGVRDNLDKKEAMLTNSLFLDFLKSHGLDIYKENSTRDIVCLEFGYGSRSYEEEIKHMKKLIKDLDKNYRISNEERERRRRNFEKILQRDKENKDKFVKKSKQEIRTEFYVNGVPITYKTFNRSGEVIAEETIHYKMLFRSAGKAKKGSVMFIRDELYDDAIDFLRMGIKLPEHNAPIVEIGAYSSLIASTIVGKVRIKPENILILKDYDSFFTTDVISVEPDENRHCLAVPKDNYTLKNTMFDGQALIDSSIFPTWGDGYVLLRQHFCKMAAFCTHIQKFFKDYYGDQYETAVITDMFGNDHYAKDIQLITTENAVKWLKFDVSYEYWCQKVHECNDEFGIVKTSHKSKLGDVQKMSYQMVNTFDINSMDDALQTTEDYIMKMKLDDNEFLRYLEKNKNFSNDYEVLIALVDYDPDFIRSSYFRERKRVIISNYLLGVKSGKVIEHGDNLTIVGSPYGMLMYTVGLNPEDDPTFEHEDGTIQCYTGRFDNDEYLAGFRSPMNGMQNVVYMHNHYHEYFTKYFDLGKQIIATNMVHTDFQDRCNGLTYWASVQ